MKKTQSKIVYLILSIMILVATIMMGCAKPKVEVAVSEWHIPTCIWQTGPFAGQGIPARWIAEQAAEEINAKGGISSKPIVLDFFDTGMDPAKATAAMSKAIDAKALCTIGPWLEMEAQAALPIAEREGIFEIASGGEDTARQYFPWTVWLDFSKDDLRYVMRMWVKEEPGMKSIVALLHEAFASVVTMCNVCRDELGKLGIADKGGIDVAFDTIDFGPPVTKALATGADTFIIFCTPDIGANIVNGLVRAGVDPKKIFIGDAQCDPVFINLSKGSNEGIYGHASLTYNYKDKWTELNKAYSATHNGELIPVRWYEFYDAIYLIKDAIEKKGITGDPTKLKEERIAIRDYISNVKNFNGCKFTYDIVNNAATIPMYLFQMRNGKFEYVASTK